MMRPLAIAGAIALVVLSGCGRGDRADRGGLCGVPGLVGERVPDVTSSNLSCGIDDPVQVTRVRGIMLSQPALMTCQTAQALDRWTVEGAERAVGNRGGGIARFEVAAHYSCRTRNSQRGARISEHAKGNAIDISGITLADGTRITVSEGWNGARRDARVLRQMHAAASGPFGTVLGPESDRFHQNHLHFDVARHRGGPYCR
ncbi:MAG: extensin family protein [Pseudomonadota bacterium]